MGSSRVLVIFLFVFSLFSFQSGEGNDRLLIFTYSYNRPDFIEIQHQTFQKFLLDDYQFVVFNDANQLAAKEAIKNMCDKLQIPCIDMPQHLHKYQDPSHRNAAIVNYSLNQLGFNYDGIVVLIDSDLFLVKEFSIVDYMKNYALSGWYQDVRGRGLILDYIWVGLVFLDIPKLPDIRMLDFTPGMIKGVQTDTGGFTHHYLRKHRGLPIRYMDETSTERAYKLLKSCSCEQCLYGNQPCAQTYLDLLTYGNYDENQIRFIATIGEDNSQFFIGSHFFHYRCGSNWDNKSSEYHQNKTKCFNDYIQSILKN